jgi:hypothetical protein
VRSDLDTFHSNINSKRHRTKYCSYSDSQHLHTSHHHVADYCLPLSILFFYWCFSAYNISPCLALMELGVVGLRGVSVIHYNCCQFFTKLLLLNTTDPAASTNSTTTVKTTTTTDATNYVYHYCICSYYCDWYS